MTGSFLLKRVLVALLACVMSSTVAAYAPVHVWVDRRYGEGSIGVGGAGCDRYAGERGELRETYGHDAVPPEVMSFSTWMRGPIK